MSAPFFCQRLEHLDATEKGCVHCRRLASSIAMVGVARGVHKESCNRDFTPENRTHERCVTTPAGYVHDLIPCSIICHRASNNSTLLRWMPDHLGQQSQLVCEE